MVNMFTDGQAAIDLHNKYRQHYLAIERAIATKSFYTRLDSHFSGLCFIDAYFASKFHLDAYADMGMAEALSELAHRLIYNPVLRGERATQPTAGLGPAGAPSVQTRSGPLPHSAPNHSGPWGSVVINPHGGTVSINGGPPTRESPGKHVLIPLSQVAGYKGPKQQRCQMCNELCSWVCARCTTGPNAMIPLHPFSTSARGHCKQHNCLNEHRRDLTATYRTQLAKLTGISKNARKARRTTIISL